MAGLLCMHEVGVVCAVDETYTLSRGVFLVAGVLLSLVARFIKAK